MKPIEIIMSAFGSYADKTKISFEDVSSGIFLIAGDTGSGKTTVFDAIIYALYEQTSGGVRDGNMMRSQYASDNYETYVELTFRYLNNIYKIRRNPEYLRPSKRGGGYTSEPSKVELTMPDGKAFIGKKVEINNKISEIIGLDKEQFTQIAMIAQGDFLKLLHASSDERSKIFSKIFDTKIYSRIQDILKNKEKEINTELAKNKTLCEREINNIKCIEESSYESFINTMHHGFEFKMDEITKLLDDIGWEIAEKEKYITIEKNKISDKIKNINSIISSSKTINDIFDKLSLSLKTKEELQLRKNIFIDKKIALKNAQNAEIVKIEENKYSDKLKSLEAVRSRIVEISQWLTENELKHKNLKILLEKHETEKCIKEKIISEEAVIIKNTLPKYKILETKKSEMINLEVSKNNLENIISELKCSINDKKISQQKILKEQENLNNCYQIHAKLLIEVNDIDKKRIDLENLCNTLNELDELKTVYNISLVNAQREFESYHIKNEYYERCYREFLSEQAGILAKERLIDNEPCPVCGSTKHPNIASLSDNAPTQTDVENAKLGRDKAEELSNAVKERLQDAKSKYYIKIDLADKKAKDMLLDYFDFDGDMVSKVSLLLGECLKKLGKLKAELEKAGLDIDKFEKNKLYTDSISKELSEQTNSLDLNNSEYAELISKYESAKAFIEEINNQLLYSSEFEAKNQIIKFQNELDRLNSAVADSRDKYNTLSEAIGMKRGNLSSEKENLKRIELEALELKSLYFSAVDSNFESESIYQNAKLQAQEIIRLQREIEEYDKKNNEIDQAISIYTEQTKDKEKIQTERFESEQASLEKLMLEFDNKLKNIYALSVKNTEVKGDLAELFAVRKQLRASYEIYSTLSSTANGRLTDKSKIDFETYIQRQYFNKIISAANKRLIKMTSNQFILQCREFNDLGNRGSVGLDLDVYSLITDTIRDVKTLSGGESFMASLSMALGMADVVQRTAGAVHIDTMFIDEGFGSLDDISRTQAISVLNELAGNNRLVGIISHVNELKEQIDNKLIITKTENGSKARWLLE